MGYNLLPCVDAGFADSQFCLGIRMKQEDERPMDESLEKMMLESQNKDVLYVVDLLILELADLGVATSILAWRAKSEGKLPVTGDTITAFGKQFMVVGAFGNKIFVKSSADGKGVARGQRV